MNPINGQTGNIHGAYPKSPVKIAALVITVLIILAAIFFGSSAQDDSYYGSNTDTGYESTYNEYQAIERNINDYGIIW